MSPLTQTPALAAGRQVAANLVGMTRTFKSNDPVQATGFRQAFKELSKNDLTRTIVYLLELVGSRDVEFKYLKGENTDLRELLKLNGIDPDKDPDEAPTDSKAGSNATEGNDGTSVSQGDTGNEQTGTDVSNREDTAEVATR